MPRPRNFLIDKRGQHLWNRLVKNNQNVWVFVGGNNEKKKRWLVIWSDFSPPQKKSHSKNHPLISPAFPYPLAFKPHKKRKIILEISREFSVLIVKLAPTVKIQTRMRLSVKFSESHSSSGSSVYVEWGIYSMLLVSYNRNRRENFDPLG
jgi:hypothetical protein